MVGQDPAPQTRLTRTVSLAAVMFAVLAPVLYIVIFGLISVGVDSAGRVYSPFAITATLLGLVSSIWAITIPRARIVGITTLLVLVPCVFLAVLSVVAIFSAA